MNKEIINNITETIIDNLYDTTVEYMYNSGKYLESNDKFVKDQEKFVREVIKELNFRIKVVEEKENNKLNKKQKLCMKHQNTGNSINKRNIPL